MSQSKLGSFVEAWTNVAVGFGVSWLANMLVLPYYGMPYSVQSSFDIAVIFTAISLARSYLLRRFFNGMRHFQETHS